MRGLMLLVIASTLLIGCTNAVPEYPVYESDPAALNVRFDACMAALPNGAGDGDLEDAVWACHNVADHQTRRCVANCPSTGATPDNAAMRGTEPRGDGLRMDGHGELGEAAAPAASPSEE